MSETCSGSNENPASKMDRKETILRAFLGIFGIGIAVFGVGLTAFTIQNWSTPPYGLAGGMVAIVTGFGILHVASTEIEL